MAGTTLSGKKIKEFSEVVTLNETDDFILEDDTPETVRVKWSTVLAEIKKKLSGWIFNKLETADKTLPGAVNELKMRLDDYILIEDIHRKGFNLDFLNFDAKSGYKLINAYNCGLDYNNVLVTGVQYKESDKTYRVRFNTVQTGAMDMLIRLVWLKVD